MHTAETDSRVFPHVTPLEVATILQIRHQGFDFAHFNPTLSDGARAGADIVLLRCRLQEHYLHRYVGRYVGT